MRWQFSPSRIDRPSLFANVASIAILVWSISILTSISAEPVNQAAETTKPRVFVLQLVGQGGKPVPNGEVSFRNTPAPKAEQVKVGEFVRANKYSARIKTDSAGKLAV